MKHKILTPSILWVVFIFSTYNFSLVWADGYIPVVYAETNQGIQFYAFGEKNALEVVGHLPEDFTLGTNDPSRNPTWFIQPSDYNLALSPNGQQIAITARRLEDNQTGFFIYTTPTAELKQVFVANFQPPIVGLRWSPDSQAVLLQPIPCDCPGALPFPETYVYEVATKRWLALTNTPGVVEYDSVWMPDSNGIVYGVWGGGIFTVDRAGNNRHALVDFQTNPPQTTYAGSCHFTWSDTTRRWYYAAGCPVGPDTPYDDMLYSVDLDGSTRLEADLPTIFRRQFEQSNDHGIFDGNLIEALHPLKDGGMDMVVSLRSSGDREQYFWRVIETNQYQTLFEISGDTAAYTPEMVRFSPDNQWIAFRSYDGKLIIGDLTSGETVAQIEGSENVSPCLMWLNQDKLLYNNDSDVWLMDVPRGTKANLTADIEAKAWLLPQINWYEGA